MLEGKEMEGEGTGWGVGGDKTLKRHVSILAGQLEWVCHKHCIRPVKRLGLASHYCQS